MMRPGRFFLIGFLCGGFNAQAQTADVATANEVAEITSQLGPKLARKKNVNYPGQGQHSGQQYGPGGQQPPTTAAGTPTPTVPGASGQYPGGEPDSDQDQSGDQGQDGGNQQQPVSGQVQPGGTPSPGVMPGQAMPQGRPGMQPMPQPTLQPRFPQEQQFQPRAPESQPVIAGQLEEVSVPSVLKPAIKPTQVSPEKLEEELVGKDAQELYMEPGNYLRKAQALRKAQEGDELLRALLSSLEDTEKKLVEQRLGLDEAVQKFYDSIGFTQGQLQARVKQLMENLEQDQVLDGQLSEEEREIQQELTQQIELLKKVQDDVSVFGKLLLDLDKGLLKVTDQIAQVRDYEARAWKNYQTIDALRNDQEAMVLANEIMADDNSFVANTKKIQAWLQGAFNQFFTQTIATIKQQMKAIQDNLNNLDKQGVQLSEKTAVAEKEEAEKAAQEKARKEKEAAEKAAQEKKSILNRLKDSVTRLISGIVNGFKEFGHRVYSALFGWMSKK